MLYDRITVDPFQMGGEACIRGLRIPVSTIVTMVAQGNSISDILTFYPDLEREDITQCLNFAAEAVREKQLPLKKVG